MDIHGQSRDSTIDKHGSKNPWISIDRKAWTKLGKAGSILLKNFQGIIHGSPR